MGYEHLHPEDLVYAFLDRPIRLKEGPYLRGWAAEIVINRVTIQGVGWSPSVAVDRLCDEILRYKETHPEFIIARQDI